MPKRLIPIIVAIISLTTFVSSFASCSEHKKNGGTLITDSIGFEKKDKFVECRIIADMPVDDGDVLCNIVREFISDELGGSYTGGYADMDSLLSFYGRTKYDEMYDAAKEAGSPYSVPYSYDASIRKVYETGKLVTYQIVISEYWGGAHPLTVSTAVTFRKSDGRRFGKEIFNASFNEKSSDILSDGLKKYFEVKTDKELKSCLLGMENFIIIPMPQNPPYFTKDGIVLSYGQYEIAPYAAGMPAVLIPYDEAKSLLKVSAREMIER